MIDLNKYTFLFLGEFGYELVSWIPYLKFLKEKGYVVHAMSRQDMETFYHFADSYTPVTDATMFSDCWGNNGNYNKVCRDYEIKFPLMPLYYMSDENYPLHNYDIHQPIDLSTYSLLDHRQWKRETVAVPRERFVVLNNKSMAQWGVAVPYNSIREEALEMLMKHAEKNDYDIVYIKYEMADDVQLPLDDAFFISSGNVLHLNMPSNKEQIWFYDHAAAIVNVQGGCNYIPAIMGKEIFMQMQKGCIRDYLNLELCYPCKINIFRTDIQTIQATINKLDEETT